MLKSIILWRFSRPTSQRKENMTPQQIVTIWQFLNWVCVLSSQKGPPPPTRFSPVTSANVGFGPQNLLTFCFNSFATLVQNFKFVSSASPKLLNLNQDHPSKKRFFWSNPYKIEVMITILIEMLQLPNFGHITISKIWFESRDKILLVTSWT